MTNSAHQPPRQKISRFEMWAWYILMGPLELYGRARGVYKPRYAPPAHKVHNTPCRPRGPIVCFGDSLTEGYGVPRNKSYPHYLAKQLALKPDQVLNVGRSGDTSADGLKRLP